MHGFRALIGGGGCILIYSVSARQSSFEINLISKEISRAEPEYMNMHPLPANALRPFLIKSMSPASVLLNGKLVNFKTQVKHRFNVHMYRTLTTYFSLDHFVY